MVYRSYWFLQSVFSLLSYNIELISLNAIKSDAMLNSTEQLLLVQEGKLYGRDPVFAMICKASLLPDTVKNHDLQKNETIIQLGQV